MKVSLIIPTYNEAENVSKLVNKILNVCKNINLEIIIVDDNSPDGTGNMAEKLAEKNPKIFVIHRKTKSCLSSAVLDGFKAAKGDILGVMDADLSHPPELIPKIIAHITKNNDIVIGSRLIEGGGDENMTFPRKIISLGATILCMPLTKIKDPMSGYFFLKKKVIQNTKLVPRGYKILLEILVKGNAVKLKEVPFIFKSRNYGKSKLNFKVETEFLRQLFDLYFYKLGN